MGLPAAVGLRSPVNCAASGAPSAGIRSMIVDSDTRTRVNLELLQYVQPKLKSIEVKAKVAAAGFDVSDEQARRLAEAFIEGTRIATEEELLK